MNNKTLYFQSDNKNDNYAYIRCHVEPFKPIDKFKNIGDGKFDILTKPSISYIGTYEFGTLCNITGEEFPLPVYPWYTGVNLHSGGKTGDILSYDDVKKKIGNTSKNKKNVLKWHKFIDGDKILYFCDRVILVNVDYVTLHDNGLINSIIEIDNKKFFCRVPTKKEIYDYIKNDSGIQNVPIADELDMATYFEHGVVIGKLKSISNKFWNHVGISTLCYDSEGYSCLGYYFPTNKYSDSRTNWNGWRPVLEELEYKNIKVNLLKDSIYQTSNKINLNKITDIQYLKNKKEIQLL